MTPIWIFPAYPLLLMAPIAANLIDALPDSDAAARINATAMTAGAICIQGIGFLVSLMIYSAFIYRLMTQKLPRETTRPGMVRQSLIFRHDLTDFLVRFRRAFWIHSSWYCSTRKHHHAKGHAGWGHGRTSCWVLPETSREFDRLMALGLMSLVLHRQCWSPLAINASQ